METLIQIPISKRILLLLRNHYKRLFKVQLHRTNKIIVRNNKSIAMFQSNKNIRII